MNARNVLTRRISALNRRPRIFQHSTMHQINSSTLNAIQMSSMCASGSATIGMNTSAENGV